jgi:hypothetical protein
MTVCVDNTLLAWILGEIPVINAGVEQQASTGSAPSKAARSKSAVNKHLMQ